MFITVELQQWAVVVPSNMVEDIRAFIQMMKETGLAQNFRISEPQV